MPSWMRNLARSRTFRRETERMLSLASREVLSFHLSMARGRGSAGEERIVISSARISFPWGALSSARTVPFTRMQSPSFSSEMERFVFPLPRPSAEDRLFSQDHESDLTHVSNAVDTSVLSSSCSSDCGASTLESSRVSFFLTPVTNSISHFLQKFIFLKEKHRLGLQASSPVFFYISYFIRRPFFACLHHIFVILSMAFSVFS